LGFRWSFNLVFDQFCVEFQTEAWEAMAVKEVRHDFGKVVPVSEAAAVDKECP
jgi:hypothetical protein